MSQARYIRIMSKFWTDEKVVTWDEETKLLALYILTSPHNNMLGCYILPRLYICADLKIGIEQLDKPFNKLLEDEFIKYDDQNNLLLITNFLKHNPIENQNQATAASKIINELPKSPLLSDLKQLIEQLDKPFLKQLAEQLPEPVTVTVTVNCNSNNNICSPVEASECEKTIPAEKSASEKAEGAEQEKSVRKDSEYTQEFLEFWNEYPRKVEKKAAFRCYQARKREGHLPRDMLYAAARYKEECLKNGTEEKYIKHPKTFLGASKPFLEYLKTSTTDYGKVVNFDEFKPYTGESTTEFKPYRG